MNKSFTFFILGLTLISCSGKKKLKDRPFVYCSEGSPSNFNPQVTTDGTSSNATSKTIYNTLVQFKYGETILEPALAQSWNISQDGLTYTFKLRADVSFHQTPYFTPTRTFNADDVLFSFNRQRLSDHPYHQISGGTYEYFNAMDMGNIIQDIKKINDHTVAFILSKPEAPFLANLAMGFTSILSKEYADNLKAQGKMRQLDQKPIGTGPFIFKKYSKDTLIRYQANEKYFAGAPSIKKLVFSITPDASVRFQKLKKGECDFVAHPAPQDLEAMKSDPSINLLNAEGLNIGYLAMNTKVPPFDNVLVRRAIAHALNRQAYIQAIYLGHAVVAKNPIPPTMWSYDSKAPEIEYDPKLARELLIKAGFKNGFETEIWTLPVSRPYNPNGKKMGEMMQADLSKIGIKVKLVSYDWPTYLDKARKAQHQLIQLGWTGDNADPDNFLNTLLGCSAVKAGANVAQWCHGPFEKIVQDAKIFTDTDKRTQLYLKAQQIFGQQMPWVPLAHSIVFRAMRKHVQGYKIDPLGLDIFHSIKIEDD